jgi:hypothetical protein
MSVDTRNLENLAELTESYSIKPPPTRKRVTHACVYCSRSHASCDAGTIHMFNENRQFESALVSDV